jgi:hypothetical protein
MYKDKSEEKQPVTSNQKPETNFPVIQLSTPITPQLKTYNSKLIIKTSSTHPAPV